MRSVDQLKRITVAHEALKKNMRSIAKWNRPESLYK